MLGSNYSFKELPSSNINLQVHPADIQPNNSKPTGVSSGDKLKWQKLMTIALGELLCERIEWNADGTEFSISFECNKEYKVFNHRRKIPKSFILTQSIAKKIINEIKIFYALNKQANVEYKASSDGKEIQLIIIPSSAFYGRELQRTDVLANNIFNELFNIKTAYKPKLDTNEQRTKRAIAHGTSITALPASLDQPVDDNYPQHSVTNDVIESMPRSDIPDGVKLESMLETSTTKQNTTQLLQTLPTASIAAFSLFAYSLPDIVKTALTCIEFHARVLNDLKNSDYQKPASHYAKLMHMTAIIRLISNYTNNQQLQLSWNSLLTLDFINQAGDELMRKVDAIFQSILFKISYYQEKVFSPSAKTKEIISKSLNRAAFEMMQLMDQHVAVDEMQLRQQIGLTVHDIGHDDLRQAAYIMMMSLIDRDANHEVASLPMRSYQDLVAAWPIKGMDCRLVR